MYKIGISIVKIKAKMGLSSICGPLCVSKNDVTTCDVILRQVCMGP